MNQVATKKEKEQSQNGRAPLFNAYVVLKTGFKTRRLSEVLYRTLTAHSALIGLLRFFEIPHSLNPVGTKT